MNRHFDVTRTIAHLRKNWFLFFTFFFFLVCTAAYMGPGLFDCKNSIYGFGDSTAGPIWRNSLENQPMFGGYETQTNYPVGENLYSPLNYAAFFQTVTMNVGSKIVGPMCAYNSYNVIGYLLTAMIMFAFVYYITKNRWISLLAGYSVSFTPYVQTKIGGHPSYSYAAILIALLWLTLHVVARRQKKMAALLGIVLAGCAYIDPYFVLMAITIFVPIVAVWLTQLIYDFSKKRKDCKKELLAIGKLFAIFLVFFVIAITPIATIRVKDSALIAQSVKGVRGDVTAAAQQCSNLPLDYILPDPRNVFLLEHFGEKYANQNIKLRNWCGYGESRVSISLAILLTITLTIIIMFWERLSNRRLAMSSWLPYRPSLLVYSLLLVGLAAFLTGLPPTVGGIATGSGLILKITDTWRIFAREFIVLNIATVALLSILLSYLAKSPALKHRQRMKIILYLVLFAGIASSYQVNNLFSPPIFNYNRDVPKPYKEVKDNKSIKAIAEYPIDKMGTEYDSVVYYLTMQAYHGKPIYNNASIAGIGRSQQFAIRDLTDPQTLPALRYLGINYLVIHGESPNDIVQQQPQLTALSTDKPVVYSLQMVRRNDLPDVTLTKISEGLKLSNILTPTSGFVVNVPLIQSPLKTEYEATNNAVLELMPLLSDKVKDATVCFEVKMAARGDVGLLTVYSRDKIVSTTSINDVYQRVVLRMSSGDKLKLNNDKGYNMRINNLNAGCDE